MNYGFYNQYYLLIFKTKAEVKTPAYQLFSLTIQPTILTHPFYDLGITVAEKQALFCV